LRVRVWGFLCRCISCDVDMWVGSGMVMCWLWVVVCLVSSRLILVFSVVLGVLVVMVGFWLRFVSVVCISLVFCLIGFCCLLSGLNG